MFIIRFYHYSISNKNTQQKQNTKKSAKEHFSLLFSLLASLQQTFYYLFGLEYTAKSRRELYAGSSFSVGT